MKFLTVDQIREKYLEFFASKGHLVAPSFPVVPINDNSLLLINAGMTPLKPYFTGQQTPPNVRMATCQKCIRTSDIENVGKNDRHRSFFEMLGNFSFGDYFKKECIPWAWEFVTRVMEIPADRLWVSVYLEDDEAHDIWTRDVGVPAERVVRLGKEDNFWEHGIGPCGPCSEIHFDRGAQVGCGKPDCAVGCDCDRFMEIWNLVFTQFNRNEDGSYTPLEKANIDTGMGLERMAVVMQGVNSVHEIDNSVVVCERVRQLAGISCPPPDETEEQRVAINIIADHVRCVTIMASDGVRPGADGRDYVMRRLLRRAVRYARNISFAKRLVAEVAQTVIDIYKASYPNLVEKSAHILQILAAEEARFLETLETGMALLEKNIAELKKSGEVALAGADAFKLYDTFGFPPDITREILDEAGLDFDQAGFDAEMEAQRTRARAARGAATFMGADETVYHQLPPNLPTEFVGYAHDLPLADAFSHPAVSCRGEVLALIADGAVVQEAHAGQDIAVILSQTVFYAASGGQVGDAGEIYSTDWVEDGDSAVRRVDAVKIDISDTVKVAGENIVHIGRVTHGMVRVGDMVSASIGHPHYARRLAIMRNHTATHILQRALRDVVGDHIEQAGSEVTPDRLRFDFTHHAPLTPDERAAVEAKVNEIILEAMPVITEITTPEAARAAGALALFGEKYGETVRLVSIAFSMVGAYSRELCGGTHVSNTSEIGSFKLISEAGIAAGVRRIEAATGERAITLYREAAAQIVQLAEIVKAPPQELSTRIAALAAENRELKKASERVRAEAAKGQITETAVKLLEKAVKNGEFTLISAVLSDYDIESLRLLSDKIKASPVFAEGGGCLLLAAVSDESVQFLASATDNAVKCGVHAGNIVKAAAQMCGGNGGGRPNHAQAGGKDASQADAALAAGLSLMKEMLGQ